MPETIFKTLPCGKKIAGYGVVDLEKNFANHVKQCPNCKPAKATLVEKVSASNPKIVPDTPKFEQKTGADLEPKEGLFGKKKKKQE